MIVGVTDDAHHLAQAALLTCVDKRLQQAAADTAPTAAIAHVNRVFDGVAVRYPWPVRSCIGKTHDGTVAFARHEVGQLSRF